MPIDEGRKLEPVCADTLLTIKKMDERINTNFFIVRKFAFIKNKGWYLKLAYYFINVIVHL